MKSTALFYAALICVLFSSCGNTYRTQASGQDDISYITVLREKYVQVGVNSVMVVVDDVEYPYGRVEKVNRKIKSQPIRIEPGKHRVEVLVDGETVSDETVFLGVQQNKTIIIR